MKFTADRFRLLLLLCCGACVQGCQNPATPSASTTAIASGDVARNQQAARDQTDRAYALIQQSQYDQAEALLKQAVVADPLYGPAQNDMGLICYHRDDLYNAAWEFENASKLMPRQAPPVNNLGLVYEKANRLTDAEKSYAAALELDPDNTEYAGNLARVRIRLGERDDPTHKLLDLIIMKDRRPEWVAWAREQASRMTGHHEQEHK